MRIVISTAARLARSADGTLVTWRREESYPYWARYLAVFDEVLLLARVCAAGPAGPAQRAPHSVPAVVTGPGVRVVPVPDFRGVASYLRTLPALRRMLAAGLAPGGVLAGTGHGHGPGRNAGDVRYVVYAPGLLGGAVVGALADRGLGYGLEVTGDPADAATHRLGPWAGTVAGRLFAERCARAAAVRYVTREALQRRYPAPIGAVVADYPEVLLDDTDFVAAPRPLRCAPSPVTLLAIGSQGSQGSQDSAERRGKGLDVLVRAVSMLRAGGRDVRAVLVGGDSGGGAGGVRGGGRDEALVASIIRLGLRDSVRLVPELDRAGVNAALDAADLFVLPSSAEALPRVLVEAMARAVPAVASAVGGVAELLDPADLVPPGDPVALSRRIADVVGSPRRLAAMSARNRQAAEAYRADELARRAQDFYLRLAQQMPDVPAQHARPKPTKRVGT